MAKPTLQDLTARRQQIETELAASQARLDEIERVRRVQEIKDRQAAMDAERAQQIRARLATMQGQKPPQPTARQKAEAAIPKPSQDPASATQVPQGAPPTIPTGGAPGAKPEDIKGAAAVKAAGSGQPSEEPGLLSRIDQGVRQAAAFIDPLRGPQEAAAQLTRGESAVEAQRAIAKNPEARRMALVQGLETAGRVGGLVGGPVGSAALGTAGAGAGSIIADLSEGKAPDFGAAALEGGFSLVPDVAVRAVKGTAKFLRKAPGAIADSGPIGGVGKALGAGDTAAAKEANELALEQAGAQNIRELARQKTTKFSRERGKELFKLASQAEDKLSTAQLGEMLADNFDEVEWKPIKKFLGRIEPPPGKDPRSFARQTAEAFDKIRSGDSNITGMDLDALQQVRSQMKKMKAKSDELTDIERFVDTIDDFMINGEVVSGTGQGSGVLLQARRHWANHVRAEAFADFVTKTVSKTKSKADGFELELGTLIDGFERPGILSKRNKEFVESLQRNGEAEPILTWAKNMGEGFKQIKVIGKELSKQEVTDAMTHLMSSPQGRVRLTRALRTSNGQIREQLLMSMLTATVREAVPDEQASQAINQAGQSVQQRIPGVGL